MQPLSVAGYEMAYLEVGRGRPLVCVHGTLGDFRTWSAVMGPLSKNHRVISVSLRHFFPELWDGVGDDYLMAQHIADTIGFLEKLGDGPVDLMGHSRGGHIAFRTAQLRPDLLRRLILAEPGGELDATLDPSAAPDGASQRAARFAAAASKVADGDIEGALKLFFDTIDGRVARLTKTQSALGVQLDSLADVISFGVAPASLLYRWSLEAVSRHSASAFCSEASKWSGSTCELPCSAASSCARCTAS